MAITYSSIDLKGVVAEPILEELLFANGTIANGLVTLEDQVKAETIFTEVSATAAMQAYTCGSPGASGDLTGFDTAVTPVKGMFYQEFCPDNLRFSRFKRDMKPGAWETLSNEFEQVVIGGVYAKNIAALMEEKFWNNATSATKTAVAALTAGTLQTAVGVAEKTLVAATTAGLFDGVVTRMIYNDSNAAHTAGVGGRIKVVGTTITSSNIKTEYEKVYAAIPAVVLGDTANPPYIYAPRSHKQLINIYNNTPTNYKDAFSVSDDKTRYYFNGVEIVFVPIPENVMIAAKKEYIFWCTDLSGDYNQMKIDRIAENRDDMFIKNVFTLTSHVANQAYNVLYVG